MNGKAKKTSECVSVALNATQDIEEANLREIAFEATLKHLLGNEDKIATQPPPQGVVDEEGEKSDVPDSQAAGWMYENEVTQSQLDRVFFLENGNEEIIATEIPGGTDSQKTKNAYVIAGLFSLFISDDTHFDDRFARDVCDSFNCYDASNHTKRLKNTSSFVGSKAEGWQLTGPGLKCAARLVNQMTDES